VPFWSPVAFTIDRLAVNVTTGVAAANVRVLIYNANANGTPNSRLVETANLGAATTNTFPEATVSHTFAANTLYWVGVHHSSTATLRGIAVAALLPIGLASATATSDGTCLRTTPTFGSSLSTYSYAASQITSAIVPAVRMRAA
jgi:hypothetical protein